MGLNDQGNNDQYKDECHVFVTNAQKGNYNINLGQESGMMTFQSNC